MNPLVYNAFLLAGVSLIGTGVGLMSVPAALIAVGTLVIALTLFGALATRN